MIDIFTYILMGCALSIPLYLLNLKLAPRFGLIDWPKARGLAEEQIPIIGHTLVITSILFFTSATHNFSPWFLTTAIILAVMGHFDDQKPVPSLDKLFFQVVCVTLVVWLDPNLRTAIGAKYGVAGNLWAIFFILGLMNAINFIDGIDGLAGLVLAAGAAGFLILSREVSALPAFRTYSGLLMGMLLPFLFLNVAKRKGFLGNVGSYFLSYTLAVMHLSIPLSCGKPVYRLSLSALCFLVPIADALMVIFSRLLTKRSPFHADKGHLHHRMVQTNIPLRYILLTFAVIEVAGLHSAYSISYIAQSMKSNLPLVLCLGYVLVSGTLIFLLEKASKRRIQVFFEHLDSGESAFYFKFQVKDGSGKQVSANTLNRLEARIHAEIRIHDICFSQSPDTVYIVLRTMAEPLRSISNRIEQVFAKEGLSATTILEKGQILKSTTPQRPSIRKTA